MRNGPASLSFRRAHYMTLEIIARIAYLLYTGITRGKRLVVLVGQKKAIAIAVATCQVVVGGRSCASGWRRQIPSEDTEP
jgi:hypothetical protein